MRLKSCLIVAAVLGFAALGREPVWAATEAAPGRVYVVLWFDTEDYILPESDDAAKRVAEMLTRLGVRATFKVVGEKARTLERRGRSDVIAAVARHEIGYHSNTHSQHPTPAEYEATLDWPTGVLEFDSRERPGFDDVRRVFGQAPTCYGQPGSSWAPQAYAALQKWGVKVYLDEGSQVGLDGRPFWYGGLLNIFNTKEGSTLHPNPDWSNVAEARARFQAIHREMSSRPEGGVVSLYFHPCEFIHREFWDGVNFARGANPPREEWKRPPMKTREESDRAFRYLEDLVAYMKTLPNTAFLTASDALRVFADTAQGRSYSGEELARIAARVTPEISFQVHDDFTLAPSEVFELLSRQVAAVVRNETPAPLRLEGTLYGPASAFDREEAKATDIPWSQFSRTVIDVADYQGRHHQMPSTVFFGSLPVTPESYLVALAQVSARLLAHQGPPASVQVAPAHLAAGRYVADDAPELWGWVIFPPGFRAPKLMGLARLQAWTLKPARPSAP
ncbi:MAG TPA: polysaccharide deacetylase family protein [Vicinamibacteria bacterium]|nr:polysaccharide deacetylase family protein [Vicinamibacteria bacterium]